jgi:hypothetical protein
MAADNCDMIEMFSSKLAQARMLLTCILKKPISDLSKNTGHRDRL